MNDRLALEQLTEQFIDAVRQGRPHDRRQPETHARAHAPKAGSDRPPLLQGQTPATPHIPKFVIEARDALSAARAFPSEHPLTESDCTTRVTNLEPITRKRPKTRRSEKNCGFSNRGCLNKR
jgi:hypothetical protein